VIIEIQLEPVQIVFNNNKSQFPARIFLPRARSNKKQLIKKLRQHFPAPLPIAATPIAPWRVEC
jgi:hypothetical protein